MEPLVWIIGSGLVMSAIAMVGSIALFLSSSTFEKIVLPLIAFSAGSLLGGAFFHMLPEAVEHSENALSVYIWFLAGFSLFFVIEQALHWHHCHRQTVGCQKPLGYLILIGDGLHNFLGGVAIASTFLVDIRLGVATFLAAMAHEIPQELGDFAVLVHSGWTKGKALMFNMLSALPFLLGGLLCYYLSRKIDVSFLVPIAAGNFVYIAASDLIPEVNRHFGWKRDLVYLLSFLFGLALLLVIRLAFEHSHGTVH